MTTEAAPSPDCTCSFGPNPEPDYDCAVHFSGRAAPPASLAAAYPTIDYGRLTEIIEEVTELAQSDELLFVDEDGRGMFRGRVPTEPAQGGER